MNISLLFLLTLVSASTQRYYSKCSVVSLVHCAIIARRGTIDGFSCDSTPVQVRGRGGSVPPIVSRTVGALH